MFLGTYTPKLDEKGRLFLPAKFREELMTGLVVTTGQERCLTVYKVADFAEIAARVQAAPITVKGARDYGRFLGANANQDTPDRQGRITITPMQRDYASLTKDVMVIGVINRIEIWDPDRWQSYNQQNQDTFADVSEEVFPGL
jgi:MraZ protein